jgi:polysaccharide biosynthesis PFTS motif protein
MNIPVITKLFKKKHISKIRAINIGHKRLKSENRLELLRQLKDILTKTKLNNTSLLKSFFHRGDFDIELSIRQYLTVRILGYSFNKSILYCIGSNKSLSHPLPKEWRDALINQGINVNHFNSALLWHANGFLYWCWGVLSELKSIYFLLKKQPNLGKYIFFADLTDNNISANPNRHNIVNWYLRWKNIEINSICHSASGTSDFKLGKVDIVHTNGLPKLIRTKLLKYVGFFIYEMIHSFLWLFFKPAYGFLISESMKLKRVDLANDADLARDYLFNSSAPYYRPIWTYVAEDKGSRILYYDYSTNTAHFKNKNGYPIEKPWHLRSWPHYLVWNEFHADFIRRHDKHNSVIENVGHIWFSSSGKCADIPLNSIAVFDVVPHRPTKHIEVGFTEEYYTFKITNQFLSDIQLVLSKSNMCMPHKRKRITKFAHKNYIRRIRQLSKELNYINIYPNIDPLQVIQKTKACISMPFTSTAIIAKQEGKASVYYDPTGIIHKDDGSAHGIEVLSGINELEEWVEKISNDKME